MVIHARGNKSRRRDSGRFYDLGDAGSKFGWFVEPTYSYSFSKGHEKSVGASFGVLIPVPCKSPRAATDHASATTSATRSDYPE